MLPALTLIDMLFTIRKQTGVVLAQLVLSGYLWPQLMCCWFYVFMLLLLCLCLSR